MEVKNRTPFTIIVILLAGILLRGILINSAPKPDLDSCSTLSKVNLSFKDSKDLLRPDSIRWYDIPELKRRIFENHTGLNFRLLYRNLKASNHPPLYYYIYHPVKVFFDNGSSGMRSGFILNLVFWTISFILFFKISKRIFENRATIVAAMLLYAFYLSSIKLVILLKSYCLQEMLLLGMVWVATNEKAADKVSIRNLVLYGLISTLFLLTHYFSYLHLASLSVALLIFHWKNWKIWAQYGLATLLAVLAAVYTYPRIHTDLRKNHRSEEIQEAITGTDLVERVQSSVQFILSEFLGIILLIMIMAGLVTWIFRKRSRVTKAVEPKARFLLIISAVFMFSAVLTIAIAPYEHVRYISVFSPYAILISVFFVKNWTAKPAVTGVLACLLVGISIVQINNWNKERDKETLLEQFDDEANILIIQPERTSYVRMMLYSINGKSIAFHSSLDHANLQESDVFVILDTIYPIEEFQLLESKLLTNGLQKTGSYKRFLIYH